MCPGELEDNPDTGVTEHISKCCKSCSISKLYSDPILAPLCFCLFCESLHFIVIRIPKCFGLSGLLYYSIIPCSLVSILLLPLSSSQSIFVEINIRCNCLICIQPKNAAIVYVYLTLLTKNQHNGYTVF